jgi:glycerol-3-phosphate dehydrogenase (NAD(P)+)
VLGAGAWGTALARLLVQNGNEVRLWTWQEDHAADLRTHRENRAFLPGVALPEGLEATSRLGEALEGAEWVVLVVPSQAVRATLEQCRPHLPPAAPWVCASKGIEEGTLQLMSDVLTDVLGGSVAKRSAVLSGPSFAREVARGMPTNVVAAATDLEVARRAQELFSNDWFRVYTNMDPTGVEIGGALKNVIAIAAGACDGLGFGHNTRAALITRGIAEMARLAVAKGGQVLTLAGLAGLGDLILTCTGELSRNRTLGVALGSGKPLAEALAELPGVAEGYLTAKSAHDLAQRLGVELPITEAVYAVLHGGKPTAEAVRGLLARPVRSEWD